MHKNRSTRQKCCTQRRRRCEQLSNPLRLEREARAKLRGGAGASEASALVRESVTYFHMRRTNRWHLLQQSGQFLRLSGQARSEAEGLARQPQKLSTLLKETPRVGPTHVKLREALPCQRARFARASVLASLAPAPARSFARASLALGRRLRRFLLGVNRMLRTRISTSPAFSHASDQHVACPATK